VGWFLCHSFFGLHMVSLWPLSSNAADAAAWLNAVVCHRMNA
jgi:hypothetical protein